MEQLKLASDNSFLCLLSGNSHAIHKLMHAIAANGGKNGDGLERWSGESKRRVCFMAKREDSLGKIQDCRQIYKYINAHM
jgi:hypothetical protein